MKKRNLIVMFLVIVIVAVLLYVKRDKIFIGKSEINEIGQNQIGNEQENVYYNIPELGVRFKTTKYNADNLSYYYKENYDKEIGKSHKTIGIICGFISKYAKDELDLNSPIMKGVPIKELGSYYFVYWAPQEASCSDSKIKIDFKNVIDNLEEIK